MYYIFYSYSKIRERKENCWNRNCFFKLPKISKKIFQYIFWNKSTWKWTHTVNVHRYFRTIQTPGLHNIYGHFGEKVWGNNRPFPFLSLFSANKIYSLPCHLNQVSSFLKQIATSSGCVLFCHKWCSDILKSMVIYLCASQHVYLHAKEPHKLVLPCVYK